MAFLAKLATRAFSLVMILGSDPSTPTTKAPGLGPAVRYVEADNTALFMDLHDKAAPNFDVSKLKTSLESRHYNLLLSNGSAPTGPHVVFVWEINTVDDPARIADFNAWYNDEHFPLLSQTAGFIRGRRYQLESYAGTETTPAEWLAIWEVETDNWVNQDDFKASQQTVWYQEMVANDVTSFTQTIYHQPS